MNIITQINVDVKTVVNVFVAAHEPFENFSAGQTHSNESDTAQQTRKGIDASNSVTLRNSFDKKPLLERWEDKKRLAIKVSERMMSAGFHKRGVNISLCGRDIEFFRCADCGQIIVKRALLCRDRLCPICAWRLAIKRYCIMQDIVKYILSHYDNLYFGFITLTCQNCKPELLRDTLESMQKAWELVRHQRWTKTAILGWAKSTEITYNAVTGELHPHYHILVVSNNDNIGFSLTAEWMRCAKRYGLTVSVAAQNHQQIMESNSADGISGVSLAGAICEVFKYSVKATDEISMPISALRHYATAINGKRLISFGGIIKTAAKELGAADLDNPDEDNDIKLCTRCKSQQVDEFIMRWSMSTNSYYAIANNLDIEYQINQILRERDKQEGSEGVSDEP